MLRTRKNYNIYYPVNYGNESTTETNLPFGKKKKVASAAAAADVAISNCVPAQYACVCSVYIHWYVFRFHWIYWPPHFAPLHTIRSFIDERMRIAASKPTIKILRPSLEYQFSIYILQKGYY